MNQMTTDAGGGRSERTRVVASGRSTFTKTRRGRALAHLRDADPVLARIIDERPDFDPRAWLRELPRMDLFGALLFQVVGQQLSVQSTRRIVERIQAECNGQFPSPSQLLSMEPTTYKQRACRDGRSRRSVISPNTSPTGDWTRVSWPAFRTMRSKLNPRGSRASGHGPCMALSSSLSTARMSSFRVISPFAKPSSEPTASTMSQVPMRSLRSPNPGAPLEPWRRATYSHRLLSP